MWRDGKTPLRVAAEAGRRDAVNALLAAGTRAEASCGIDGATALHAAVRRGDEAAARLESHGNFGFLVAREKSRQLKSDTWIIFAASVKNGMTTSFLDDSWMCTGPLSELLPALHSHATKTNVTVCDVMRHEVDQYLQNRTRQSGK